MHYYNNENNDNQHTDYESHNCLLGITSLISPDSRRGYIICIITITRITTTNTPITTSIITSLCNTLRLAARFKG